MNPEITPATPSQPIVPPQPAPRLSGHAWVFVAAAVAVLLAGGGGFVLGKAMPQKPVSNATMTTAKVELPRDATVTAECTAGRGKQYILPKDIPNGPIYDVHDNTVIGLEFVASQKELMTTPKRFLALDLKQVAYDHMDMIPLAAHAGVNEEHFHIFLSLVPQSMLDDIKCEGSATSTEHHHM